MTNKRNLFKRCTTSILMIPSLIYLNIKGGLLFNIFIKALVIISLIEITIICIKNKSYGSKTCWITFWNIYIFIVFTITPIIRSKSIYLIFLLFYNTWIFDITSYIIGSNVGITKIVSTVSPNKTWMGFIGGILLTLIFSILVNNNFRYIKEILITSNILVINSIINQLGDLLESYFKRCHNIKDSGCMMPGHGGVLDRMDSYYLCCNILAIIMLLLK